MKWICVCAVFFLAFQTNLCSMSEQKTDHVFESLKRRIYAAIIGAAYADALGRVVNMRGTAEIKKCYPHGISSLDDLFDDEFERLYQPNGPQILFYSSATAMALCIFHELLLAKNHDIVLNQTMHNITVSLILAARGMDSSWALPYRIPEQTTCNAFEILQKKHVRHMFDACWWAVGLPESNGCGPVMRAYPFGIVFAHDYKKAAQWAAQHSRITHGHPAALAACAAIAAGVAVAITEDEKMSPDDVVAIMIEQARQYDKHTASMIAQAAQDAKRGVSEKKILQAPVGSKQLLQGWVADEAIAAAVYIFVRSPRDIEQAIKLGVNSTGNSCGIVSLAAALVGAYSGKLPSAKKMNTLEDINVLQSMAKRISQMMQD